MNPSILAQADSASPLDVPLYRSGGWHPARSGKTFETVEPATGAVLGRVPDGDADDLEAALADAGKAQKEWGDTAVVERARIVRELGDRVTAQADSIGLLDARDTGSPYTEMRTDAIKGANALRYMAGLGLEMKGETIPVRPGALHYTALQPWGVVARVIAFNHPGLFTCGRLGPALMAGNAVILKAPDLAPLTVLAIAELTEDLLPPGLLSVLTGGPHLGAALAGHPEIRRLSFTGSVPTALKIAAEAAASGSIKHITYELGGKNPIVVFPDADLEAAAAAVVRGMNFTRVQGQSCGSTSRMIAHADVHDELLERVRERAGKITPGDPRDPETEMGALISREARDRVLGMVDRAVGDGARLVLGGKAPDDPPHPDGAFVMPTILADVEEGCDLARTEVFGPVLGTHRFASDQEAVRLANDVRYGLTASVWSTNIDRAFKAVEAIEAGYVWVNDVETRYPAVPFGGWKDSGVGLEHGVEELLSFCRTKAVNVKLG